MRGESSFERGVTWVEVMTDGLLLRDLQRDHQLEDCAVLILDEWHERGVNQDKIAAAAKRVSCLMRCIIQLLIIRYFWNDETLK
jgi:ATP-dependent helicase HrpB